MNALSTLAAGVVGGIWKIAAVALLAILLLVLSAGGTGWYLLASARDESRADLAAEKSASEGLRGAIREQNRAVEAMGTAKTAAEARGLAAQQIAAANGRRLDQVLSQERDARATTCDEAMPAVNRILEAIR